MAGYSDLCRSSIVATVSYDSAQTLCDVVQGRGWFNSLGSAASVSGSGGFDGYKEKDGLQDEEQRQDDAMYTCGEGRLCCAVLS